MPLPPLEITPVRGKMYHMKPYVFAVALMLLAGTFLSVDACAREPALTDAEIDAMMNAPMPPLPRSLSRDARAPVAVPEEPKVEAGMRSLKVSNTPPPTTAAASAVTVSGSAHSKTGLVPEKTYPVLTPKDALLPPNKLKEWPNLGLIVGVKTRDDAVNLVKAIEADRGAVPPQALFLTARILSEYDMMAQAALYYFVGQLRLTFDVTRWPPQIGAADLARIKAEQSKSPDQRQNANIMPTLDNPHNGMAMLASAISKPILRWAMADPARMTAALNAAKEWDAGAPYAYLPGYDVGNPAAFQDWERALGGVRVAYFTSMDNVVRGLRKNQVPATEGYSGDVTDEYDESAVTPSPGSQ